MDDILSRNRALELKVAELAYHNKQLYADKSDLEATLRRKSSILRTVTNNYDI